MSNSRLAVVTIGQAPRTDLTPELRTWLPGVDLVERGALDDDGPDEIAAMAPGPGDEVLTTRLRDGSNAIVAHHHIVPRVQRILDGLDDVDAVFLACTGAFEEVTGARPLLRPERMIGPGVAALAAGLDTVGVLVPLPEQRHHPDGKYAALDAKVVVDDASPYVGADGAPVAPGLRAAARRLRDRGAQLIVADCMGYSQPMRAALADEAGVPVVLARSVVARLAAELLDRGAPAA
ncbi:AroM family protein [Kineosporia sp. J2-2]|uniref:AroM family protein n=1 Tax=Kineosporia corallincola TaxID=2835133 RepID=A0ABS5TLP7_9ACTN|nr:AroM family protein [Kineosporia corallincola]MBT0772011.1 AroM family protein [Kineosporia corallincola]